ncbi:MAG: right-handed parallel beta-helix repeat-containing protein [Paludibacteraceae bacterium]|nr:right-handed parallel beta-helix repeat-containing protein [Paludibacteraceae bacterium]
MKKFFLIPLLTLLSCVMAWGENVAKNVTTGTEYDNLTTAIGAASAGDEIQMLADLDIAAADFIKITNSLTLDMNGHYIALTETTQAAVQVYGSGIDVTIKNGTIRNAGATYGSNKATNGIYVYLCDSCTLENVTITDAAQGVYGCRNNTILKNCTIDASTYGISTISSYTSTTVVDGGHIKGAKYGIFNQKNTSEIKIQSGLIEGSDAAIVLYNGGTLTATGGTIQGTKYYGIWAYSLKASTVNISGNAQVFGPTNALKSQHAGSNITINGGTLNSNGTTILLNKGNLTISDNALITSAGNYGVSSDATNTTGNITINGGSIGTAENRIGYGIGMKAGTLTMNGGSVYAYAYGIASQGGTLIVNDGVNIDIAPTAEHLVNGAAIALVAPASTPINATVNGGTFNATGMAFTQTAGTATINGGTFNGDVRAVELIAASANATLTIENGSFASKHNTVAATSLAAEYTATLDIKGGTFVVTPDNISTPSTDAVTISGNTTDNSGERAAYPAIVNISGGTFSGGYAGVSLWGKGAVANISGGSIDADAFAICGNGTPQNNGTEINITGGTIGSEETALAIYHPQYGTLNIENGTLTGKNSAIEMRAGNLTIKDGVFTATAQKYHCNPNGNGATTGGAAIAIAQHTTKLPISVNIQGGSFYGVYPISQCNPQVNAQEYVDLLNLVVSGGKFWATNTANVAAYTQNDKLKFRGGYYNLAPHAFVDEGYMAINNPDAAPYPTAAEGYLFKIGPFTPQTDLVIQDGPWQNKNTWENNTVPTEASNVTVAGNVTVENTEVAYAHDVTLNENATLTIKEGATLVVGDDIALDPSAKLVVEEGGQLLIAPSDELVQPTGTVTLVADGAGVKAGKTDLTDAKNFYWQHFAIPTAEKPDAIQLFTSERTPINEAITYYNEWNITEGWEAIVKDNVTTPFVGYNFTNIRPFGANVNYDFTGKLVGNASNPLVFTQRGFNFLGNSYLAPINIQALQTSMYEQGLEFTIYIFTKQGKKQIYRAINEVTASIYGIDEIKPMQGFFMYAQEATTADFQYNSAVYSAFINKQNAGASNNAPARRAASQYDAKAIIGIESAEGEYDEVVLVASNDFSDEYDLKADARKMENNGLNIYADGSFDNLAVMATNDLMGQTLSITTGADAQYTISFSNVEGELALRDNVTGAVVAIENGATYEFAAQPNTTLDARFQIVNRFNAPTAIENTEVKANVKGIYSITGMYLGEDFNALPAGVYVVDGVKIVK